MDNNWNNWNKENTWDEKESSELDSIGQESPELENVEPEVPEVSLEEQLENLEQNFVLSGEPYTPQQELIYVGPSSSDEQKDSSNSGAYDSDTTEFYSRRKSDRSGGAKYVTRRGLALALICTMLGTSGLTVGGLALGGAFNKRTNAHTGTSYVSPANYSNTGETNAALSLQEISTMNENAVVEIRTESVVTDFWIQNYITEGAGSGVIIDSDGYIMTCHHVIKDAKSITVTTKDGAEYEATVVGSDELTDVAVIKIKGTGFSTVTYGDSSTLSIGDLAVVMGNPLGRLGGSVSSGIISALDRSVEVEGKAMTLIQTDASINPGNSGGGLFDANGNLIGLVVAKASDSTSSVEGIGFAIPVNQASVIADQLIEHGKVPRPMIGIMIVDVTSELAAQQFGVDELGLYIDDVVGENAKAAGFQKGDIIKSINGNPIRNRNDLTVELNRSNVGDTVTVSVSRDGEIIEIKTVLQRGE